MKKFVMLIIVSLTTMILIGCTKGPYQVTFKDHNGSIISEQTIEHGESAIAPSDPERFGYYFIGWDKEFSEITSDLDIIARYEENEEQAAFNELLDSILNATRIKATTTRYNANDDPIQTFLLSREDYVVNTSITGSNPVRLYMNYFEEEYIGYEYKPDNQCWLRVNITEFQFNFINVNHSNMHMLPDRIELEWFNIEDNEYTLKSEYFDVFKTRVAATGTFTSYVLRITEGGLEVDIAFRAGFERNTIKIVYTNLGTNEEKFPTDIYTCSE